MLCVGGGKARARDEYSYGLSSVLAVEGVMKANYGFLPPKFAPTERRFVFHDSFLRLYVGMLNAERML